MGASNACARLGIPGIPGIPGINDSITNKIINCGPFKNFINDLPESWEPLRLWAQKNNLRVKDRSGVLTQFLKKADIPFNELGSNQSLESDFSAITLVAGFPANYFLEHKIPLTWGQTLIVFEDRSKKFELYNFDLFHVVISRNGVRSFVRMNLLDEIATHPKKQRIFLEVLNRSQNSNHLDS